MVTSPDVLSFLTKEFWEGNSNEILLNPRSQDFSFIEKFWLNFRKATDLEGKILLQSSGTTKKVSIAQESRLVVLSKKSFLNSAQSVNEHFQIDSHDSWLLTLPLFHVGGLSICARAFLSHSLVEHLQQWNVESFVEKLQQNQITWTSLVPTQIYDLIQRNLRSPQSLKGVFVGGGKLQSSLYEKALTLGWPLILSYGMTETAAMIAASQKNKAALFPLPHAQIKASDNGLICIRTSSLLDAYLHIYSNGFHLEARALDSEGYWVTADLGEVTEKGEILLRGRQSAQLKISGELVDMSLLKEKWEEIASFYDWFPQTVLLAIPDARLENKVVLCFEGTQDRIQKLDEALEKFHRQVMPYERIQNVLCFPKFPRTELGKIQENQLTHDVMSVGK